MAPKLSIKTLNLLVISLTPKGTRVIKKMQRGKLKSWQQSRSNIRYTGNTLNLRTP